MTELKHGSNVAGLQTEAILDVHTDEWIINVRAQPRLVTAFQPGCSLAFRDLFKGASVACGPAPAVPLVVWCEQTVAHSVQTPDDGAIKWWIGNAAEDGRAGTVFARLKVSHPVFLPFHCCCLPNHVHKLKEADVMNA
jgi:acyl-CoA oxidase